jgi:hypothetical protein
LVNFVADSLAYINEDNVIADKVTTELTDITNLIIEDGFNEYRFIHKSIQEFFASAFLCTLSQDIKNKFYIKCRNDIAFYSMFENTLFFLEEIDYYDYAKQLLIPSVSDLLALNGSELKDEFRPSLKLVDEFLSSVVVRGKRVNIRNKNLKSSGIDEELYSPQISEDWDGPVSEARLFNFVSQQLINFVGKEDKVLQYIIENGEDMGNGIKRARFKEIFSALMISEDTAANALLSGIEIMYRKKYNSAVLNLRNRENQVDKQGYLDFSN